MSKMVETVNEMMVFFKGDELVIDMINDTLRLANDYVQQVNSMESTMTMLRFRLDPSDFRQRVMELDTRRRRTHNALIVALKSLNRFLASDEATEKFVMFHGDIEDRYAVADWAGEVSNNLFVNRKR